MRALDSNAQARIWSRLPDAQTTQLSQHLDATRVQWLLGLHLSERNDSHEQRAALNGAAPQEKYFLSLPCETRAWIHCREP